jgi:hypothetical protein
MGKMEWNFFIEVLMITNILLNYLKKNITNPKIKEYRYGVVSIIMKNAH